MKLSHLRPFNKRLTEHAHGDMVAALSSLNYHGSTEVLDDPENYNAITAFALFGEFYGHGEIFLTLNHDDKLMIDDELILNPENTAALAIAIYIRDHKRELYLPPRSNSKVLALKQLPHKNEVCLDYSIQHLLTGHVVKFYIYISADEEDVMLTITCGNDDDGYYHSCKSMADIKQIINNAIELRM
jgi:hypothetical protein